MQILITELSAQIGQLTVMRRLYGWSLAHSICLQQQMHVECYFLYSLFFKLNIYDCSCKTFYVIIIIYLCYRETGIVQLVNQ